MISMQQRLHRGPNFGSGGFKGDPSPAPSQDLTEERPAESGRETVPVNTSGSRERHEGPQRSLPTWKGKLSLCKASLSQFNFSFSVLSVSVPS